MKDLLVYLFYNLLFIIVGLVPESFAYWLGKRLGDLVYAVFKDRRRIAIQNIRQALEVSESRAVELTKASFRHLGMVLVEFLSLPYLTKEDIGRMVKIEGVEYLKEVQEREQGFVIFTGHFGNWELLGAALALKGFPVNALARDQNNELINEHILKIRAEKGINIFANKGMAIRKAYQALKNGEGLFVLGDQKEKSPEHYTDFFGMQATVKLGPVTLAARTNSVIIPVYIARLAPGKHKIIVKEPLQVEQGITEEEKEEVISNLNSTLEDVIREYPTQWLWAHNRWKYSPDFESNPGQEEEDCDGSG